MRETAVKILLEMIMGRSSKLYNDLYNEGLINNTFEFDYTIEENYAYSAFGGESKDPLKVKEKVLEEITSLQQSGLNMETYERIRRAQKGRFVKQFNSVERIAHNFVSVYFKEVNIFDYMEVYDKITFEYVNKVFKEHFTADRLAMSVIKPA